MAKNLYYVFSSRLCQILILLGFSSWTIEDTDFEISVTSTLSKANIIVEVSEHVDIDDEEEPNDEEQPTDCISKPVFKDVMNSIAVFEN